jgi:hypothetical protein
MQIFYLSNDIVMKMIDNEIFENKENFRLKINETSERE